MKTNSLLVGFIALMLAPWGSLWAASNCSDYLSILERYQKDRKELLACGIPADDYFMASSLKEQVEWCAQATDAEVDERWDQAGLRVLRCGGTLHYFGVANDAEQMQRSGLIDALYEKVRVEPVEGALRDAILANPGKKTGVGFTPFPTAVLQEPACRLQGVRTTFTLGAEPGELEHWLVTVAPPCQRDGRDEGSGRNGNLPFWLVEGWQGHYRVLLAYRTGDVSIETSQHQGYPDIRTTHELLVWPDPGNSADVTWHYRDGAYRYADSECSNLGWFSDPDPLTIKDCLKGEEWQ